MWQIAISQISTGAQRMRWRARMRRVARSALPCVAQEIASETADQKGRAERDAAKQCRPRMGDCAPDLAQPTPSRRRPVIAFGILERIGEVLVSMMGEVGRAVDRIRKPERQRPATDQFVDATIAGRMIVDGFVLQIQLPGDGPGAERGQSPPWQIAIEIGGHKPEAVNGGREAGCRPFDAALQWRKFHDLHELRPQATRKLPFESDNSKVKPRRSQQFLIMF